MVEDAYLMTVERRVMLGKLLNTTLPDWRALSQHAEQIQYPPLGEVRWRETDTFRSKGSISAGNNYDIWQMQGGVCLRKHPGLVERLFGWFFGLLDLLLAPFRAFRNKLDAFLYTLALKLGTLGGFLSLPLAFVGMIGDFFAVFLTRLLSAIFNPLLFIRTLLSFPFWLVKTLIARVVAALILPWVAGMVEQMQKAQEALVALLNKHGWLRSVFLGMFRRARPPYPVIVPQEAVSQLLVVKKFGLLGTKTYLLVVEGDPLKRGWMEWIGAKVKQALLPFFWERTIHMIGIPSKNQEHLITALSEALGRPVEQWQ